MTSNVPPKPWYNGIIFNPEFFSNNTDTITISYANSTYLRRVGNPTSIATLTTFTGSLLVNGTIQYNDLTSQNSAFTGAGALNGSYTNSNITINGNGKITAISNGSSTIPTLANVLIAGNSAGATSINMNSKNITNGLSISATNLYSNGTYFGNGGNGSAIQIGDVDLAFVNNNSIQIGRGANSGATSTHNVAIGNYTNSAGNNAYNTIVGSYAMTNCSGGSYNTILGSNAGNTIYSGSFYTCIGRGAIAGDALTHATAIGAEAYCPTSNTIALGRSTGEDNILIYNDIILQTTQPTNTAGYLGYNNEIFANNIGAITSGTIFNNITAGFSLTAGVYLFNICIYDVKTISGRLTTLQAGISTSSTSQVGGFSNWVFGHMDYTGGATNDVIGNISYTFSVPSTATYYFLQLSTNTIALTNTAETFIQYTRIA